MIIETSVLNFKLSNTFEGNNTHMNKVEQQVMLGEMVENISHKEKSLENSKRANVISQGLEIYYLILLTIQKEIQLLRLLVIFMKVK